MRSASGYTQPADAVRDAGSHPRLRLVSLFLPTSERMKTPAKSLLHTASSLQPLCAADVKSNNRRCLDKEHIDTEHGRQKKKKKKGSVRNFFRKGPSSVPLLPVVVFICFVFFINQIGLSQLWSQHGSLKLDAAQTRTLRAGEPWQSVRWPSVALPPLPNTDLSNMDADLKTSHARCTSQ